MSPLSIRDFRTGLWHVRKGGFRQLAEWRRRRANDTCPNASAQRLSDGTFDPMAIPAYEPTLKPRSFPGLRVGVIMDDFSLQAWAYEFDTVELTPSNWHGELRRGLDLLFVESAWNGNHGAWQYQLTGSKAPSAALRDLVAACREQGIPSVFWNKEDPPHFEDFLETAKLFDAVFTTDVRLIPEYRERLGHDRVDVLQFAAQPAIHNPVRMPAIHQRGDLAFGGMYFAHKYPERREQMELLLGAAHRVSGRIEHGLTIYSRFAGGDANYQFPAPLDKHVVGSLPYEQMLSAYRAHKVFLNVNSVVDSPSMCSRCVFEILASGTPCVSTESAAIPEIFPSNEVPIVCEPQEAEHVLRALVRSHRLRDRMVHRAQRRIWQEHTYAHRAVQLLEAVGLDASTPMVGAPKVTAICSTNRPQQLQHVLEQMGRQQGVKLQLALLTHGFTADERALRTQAEACGITDFVLLTQPDQVSLGACLNTLVAAADGDILAKIDDDDLYGPNYLLDQAHALRYTGADLVGKQAVYAYLEQRDELVLRSPEREHRYTTFVAGPTLVAPGHTLVEVPFEDRTRGEDSTLLRNITAQGGRVYSTDRFNFVQRRAGQGHTWDVSDREFLANGVVETFGFNEQHVFC